MTNNWVWLRQIKIVTYLDQVIIQPFVYVWWTMDEEELVLDTSYCNTPDPSECQDPPVLMTIPMNVIKKIIIWIQCGKEQLEKHVILDENVLPTLKKSSSPIIEQ